uniref:Uncharacterized protein n=1 Tax=Candidatus Kentrum sp. UNK TaxID=2126344 RepID=A0A451AV47_9GAMM|nr:MAG: hypothetical protein BECKUNK1418G_GA0071005_10999 [Candidatus Kentron sp. UNK]VFK69916.1 MAG: hypothetical protein BECKUNK1418H_GA0071006_10219 [Candidatus Kentron sp. UNK]
MSGQYDHWLPFPFAQFDHQISTAVFYPKVFNGQYFQRIGIDGQFQQVGSQPPLTAGWFPCR